MKLRLILSLCSIILISSGCSFDEPKNKENKDELQASEEHTFSDAELEFFESNGFILDEESEVTDQFNLGHKRKWRKTKKAKRNSQDRACQSVIKLASLIWSKRAVCNHFEEKRDHYESGKCWDQIAKFCKLEVSPTDGGSVDGGSVDGGSVDGGSVDGGSVDGGSVDGGSVDGGSVDGGSVDGGSVDGGSVDGGSVDGGSVDGGSVDS